MRTDRSSITAAAKPKQIEAMRKQGMAEDGSSFRASCSSGMSTSGRPLTARLGLAESVNDALRSPGRCQRKRRSWSSRHPALA